MHCQSVMAGVRHDILVLALKDNPALLSELLERVAHARVPGTLAPADSAVRFTASLESRPDLLFTSQAPGAPWILVEVQNRPDDTKSRSWHLATSVLLQRHGMGDLVVITASRAVARWASRVARHRGALGTVKGLVPVVIHLSRKQVAGLLDPAKPHLAPFAVWARCRGHGSEAERVVDRALELTETLPRGLREAQKREILAMLDEHLLQYVRDKSMDVNKIPETKASREFRLYAEERARALGIPPEHAILSAFRAGVEARKRADAAAAEIQREALLTVLSARGLKPSPQERKRIEALNNLRVLKRYLKRAVTAASVADALTPPGARRKPAPSRRPAGRASSSR